MARNHICSSDTDVKILLSLEQGQEVGCEVKVHLSRGGQREFVLVFFDIPDSKRRT